MISKPQRIVIASGDAGGLTGTVATEAVVTAAGCAVGPLHRHRKCLHLLAGVVSAGPLQHRSNPSGGESRRRIRIGALASNASVTATARSSIRRPGNPPAARSLSPATRRNWYESVRTISARLWASPASRLAPTCSAARGNGPRCSGVAFEYPIAGGDQAITHGTGRSRLRSRPRRPRLGRRQPKAPRTWPWPVAVSSRLAPQYRGVPALSMGTSGGSRLILQRAVDTRKSRQLVATPPGRPPE
jgi:hypothetical protein